MALYRYILFKVFPFSLSEFCKVVMFKIGYNMCDRKLGFLFLSCDSRNLLSDFDSVPYTKSEKIFCLGLRQFDFC